MSYNFHLWENAYHRVFLQFSVRIKLYEKKISPYENCVTSIFGQIGQVQAKTYTNKIG